jgi:hypothetical protein
VYFWVDLNPKDSNVYRNRMNNKHATPAGSYNGHSMIFYKHATPSGSKFEFMITTMIIDSCSDQTMNPKDSNVYRNRMNNKHATLKGSYKWNDDNFSINMRPRRGRAIDTTTILIDYHGDQKMNRRDYIYAIRLFYMLRRYNLTKRSAKRADLLI